MAHRPTLFRIVRGSTAFSNEHAVFTQKDHARKGLSNSDTKCKLHRCYATITTRYVTDQWKKQIVADKLLTSPYEGKAIPKTSFPEFLFSHMEKHRNNIMLVNGITGEKFSYHNCLHNIEKVASGLIRFGLKPGDKVAIYSYNQPEYFIALMAVVACGGTAVGINPNYLESELKRQIDAIDCRFLFCHSDCAQKAKNVSAVTPSLKGIFAFGKVDGCVSFSHLLEDDGALFNGPYPVEDPKQYIGHMLGSSGTTGLPKFVCHSHYSMTAMSLSNSHEALTANSEGDMGLLVLPFYHIYPILVILIETIVGAGSVLLPKFVPETFLEAIEKYKVSSVSVVPPLVLFMLQYDKISKYDLSSLRNVINGAAPVSPDLLLQFKEKFKLKVLRQGYGMTEICPITVGDIETTNMSTVGHPGPNTELKVLDVTTRKQLGPNENGELVARNPTKMNCYFNNPEATSKTLDQDGWLYTGDIGYYDEDGHVYIVDRLKDLIKYKGHQVAPTELENLLLQHPAVKDVAVIGIPDARAGELPRAYVVLEDKLKGKVTEEDLCKFVAGQTTIENHLNGGVEFLKAIPKSPAGKILKKELRNNVN